MGVEEDRLAARGSRLRRRRVVPRLGVGGSSSAAAREAGEEFVEIELDVEGEVARGGDGGPDASAKRALGLEVPARVLTAGQAQVALVGGPLHPPAAAVLALPGALLAVVVRSAGHRQRLLRCAKRIASCVLRLAQGIPDSDRKTQRRKALIASAAASPGGARRTSSARRTARERWPERSRGRARPTGRARRECRQLPTP